jgi:dUTP pyrophosphatase
MNEINIKCKQLDEKAVIPFYAKEGDACMDITAIDLEYDLKNDRYIYHTGLAFEVPEGYYMDLRPRSSNTKTDFYIANAPGTLDAGYRGELLVVFKRRDKIALEDFAMLFKGCDPNQVMTAYVNSMLSIAPYVPGDRVCQMQVLPRPKVNIEIVEELSESERGEGGFGSTGK